MSLLSIDEIKGLVEQPKGLCVSIYMPTYRAGDIPQNPIRFKNVMRKAEEILEENGLSDIVEPIFSQVQQEAIEHYRELA